MTGTFNIWEGVYSSFTEAAPYSLGRGFEGDVYNQRAFDAAMECVTALKKGMPIPAFHKQRSNILPPVTTMMLQQRESLKVLDFGGGLGIGYMTLEESIPLCEQKIKYSIVEFPEICEQGRNSGEFDLIHSASALQYIEDWKGLIKKFISYNPKYILLSDVFAGHIPTFVTLQNYYSSKMIHWFFNLDEFLSFFSSVGYSLKMKSYVNSRRLQTDDVLPMENFPEDHRLQQTYHLLFCRES